MAKGVGVFKNSLIRVSFIKQGVTNGHKWQMFTYTNSKKNKQTGEYEKLGTYQMYVNNPIDNLKDGDYVKIIDITHFELKTNVWNGKTYQNVCANITIELPQANNDLDDNLNTGYEDGFAVPRPDDFDVADLGF